MKPSFNIARDDLYQAERAFESTTSKLNVLRIQDRASSFTFSLKGWGEVTVNPDSPVEIRAMKRTMEKILEIRQHRQREWVREATATLKKIAEEL